MSFLPTKPPVEPGRAGDPDTDAEALFKEAKRRERRRRLGGLAVVVVVCAAGLLVYEVALRPSSERTPRAAATGSATSAQTLARCIAAWNTAPLGNGRELADAVGGDGADALMFASTDGVCGLAFPSRVSTEAGLNGVFVNEVGGDWLLYASPDVVYASSDVAAGTGQTTSTHLEALADRRTNVRVELPGGKVAAKQRESMPTVPLALRDTAADCHEFPVMLSGIVTDVPVGYTLQSSTVSCPLVRAIAWTWTAGEGPHTGASEPPHEQLIVGWRCVGSGLQGSPDWGTYTRVTCSNGGNAFSVRAVSLRISRPIATRLSMGRPLTDAQANRDLPTRRTSHSTLR